MKLFVGIDVSSKDLNVCIMNHEGDTLQSFTATNSPDGAGFIRDRVLHFSDQYGVKEIQIGMESTSVYSSSGHVFS
ncbi:hypothetical protein DNHGIG_39760 [Collibacillus ludicampi]|uniref:Transposase IS110-like N-terminal domain-containing protein n=1 Tax=Collibacillus ludicampi TaxID=2771369 RepID=A0AAV4LKQ0_9BACL|nr:hypothetical protein DNHGIG_39760 [Collibacillus ludicampi]